ncbi:hypothetical protein evm_003404 [Chilo suppressalis]|nr:hypothetical protein evm_003404 [Chilo suppressalis]
MALATVPKYRRLIKNKVHGFVLLKGSRKISNFTICLLENIKVELKKENLVEKKKEINAQFFFSKSEDINANEIAINPLKNVKEGASNRRKQ